MTSITIFVNVSQSHWYEWGSSLARRLNNNLDRYYKLKRWVHAIASIDAKYGRSLKLSTNFRPTRACFLSSRPGTNSGRYLIIGIRSISNAPTFPAFVILFTADSASSMKGSLIGFMSIPYVNDRAAPPTALNSSSINNHVANRQNERGRTYCVDILKKSLGASRRRGNIFRIDSICMGW